LGGSPLVVDVLLQDIKDNVSFIALYGTDPFFSSKYTGIQAPEIKEIFPKMIDRITNERSDMLLAVEKSYKEVDPEDEALKICRWGGVPSGFKKDILQEASECGDDMRTSWDFARHVSLIAKNFDTAKRIQVERLAGKYLNLVFPRG
jgi:hypothetical protein